MGYFFSIAAQCPWMLLLITGGVLAPGQVSAPSSSIAAPSSAPPAVTFKAATRMVSVEIVAADHQGHPIPGLTADDFQVFEQIAGKRGQEAQKIAAFQAVNVAEIAAQDKGKLQIPAGVYSNFVTLQKAPVPPTILLVDGLNTDLSSQMQVHRQMIHMLASIPDDVPVAIFLMGKRLRLLQNFTTDPKLLKSALQRASSVESDNETQVDPRDDPDAMSAFLEDVPGISLETIQRFERETFAATMDVRVQETVEMLRAIARHVAGYPGRKNLLWMSSSFPVAINPDVDLGFTGIRNYQDQMAAVVSALADAKVAVYPIDPGGVQVQSYFQADRRMRGNPALGSNVGKALDREDQSRFNRQQSMQSLADQTGGKVCLSNNDLSDCIRKALDDGSSFYEIAYYPDSSAWHGEFHKIIVKTSRSGVRLAYRQGYYARPDAGDGKSTAAELQEAACRDLLTSTSVLLAAKAYPADQPGGVRYAMVIDPTTVNFAVIGDDSRALTLRLGVCTFDKSGKPLQFLQAAVEQKFTAKQYAAIQAQRGFPDSVILVPGPGTAVVRLLIQDESTGRMGSVNVPFVESAATVAPSANPAPGVQH